MRDDTHGKRSLFESTPAPPPVPTDAALAVECSRCGETSSLGALDAVRSIASFSLWVPGRAFSRRLRCPACHRRAWVRMRMT